MVRTVDGRPMVFLQGLYFPSDQGRLALFRVDLDKLTTKLIDAEAQDSNDWAVDAVGEVLARSEYDGREARWRLKVKTEQGWKTLNAHEAPVERPDLSGLGRDGGTVLVRQIEDGRPVLREITRGAAVWGDPLSMDAYGRLLKDPATHTLIGTYALINDESRYVFFDPRDQKVWKAILAAYPGERVDLVSWSADRKRIVVRVDSPTEGPAFALVDLGSRNATWLGQEFVGIGPEDISPVRPIRFKAQDGMDITGYLTLPRGRDPRNLPVVVFPHGGPASRDTLGFDWWAQAMASRGYAVLQVNFRGSDGFGWDFMKAGFGEWGRKMQTDLSDGLRHVASQGFVDPKRACIVGASYGGYAALAGVTLQQGIYRCAASVAGPSDLPRMIGWSRQQSGHSAQRYWLRFMGAENVRDDALDAISPALLADKAQAPILLIHGRDDTVVPLDQSRRMSEALKKAGRADELVVLPGDDHWLSRGATRLQMLQSVVGFLEKHNPPD
jgi:dipeptidyl aminopeptidase/acylaminoacyl peptidase